MTAMYFYLQALQTEEASVVAPFFQAGPLFAYALAWLVLGETLSRLQLLGGSLIVAGGLLLSIRPGGGHLRLRLVVLNAGVRIGAGSKLGDLQGFRPT